MDNKVLSIAIPSYNMEKYLNRCVDSLLVSEVLPQLDILIVNDGSKDNTLAIAKQYETTYPDSVTVIDKPNGNYGSCINAALAIARGKYFRILDADDWFDSNNLIRFVHALENLDVDLAITTFSREFSEGTKEIHPQNTHSIPAETVLDFPTFDFYERGAIYAIAMHTDTYRTQLLRDMGYRQTEGISYTDTEYCFYPLAHVKTFVFFNFVLYRYNFGHEGQTVSDASVKRNKNQFYTITHKILQYLLSNKSNEQPILRKQQYAIAERIAQNYYLSLLIMNDKTEEDDARLKEIDRLINELDKDLYARMSNIDYHGFYHIRVWRKKGHYFSDPNRFGLRKAYLKLRSNLKKNRLLSSLYHSQKK